MAKDTEEVRTNQTPMKDMHKDNYTNQEIAQLLGVSPQAVWQRAKKEDWQAFPGKVARGGAISWSFEKMPKSTQLAIRTAEERNALEVVSAESSVEIYKQTLAAPGQLNAQDKKRRSKALIKSDIIQQYLEWQRKHGRTVHSKEDFIEAFKAGAWPKLLAEFGPRISWKSIERWKVKLNSTDDILSLVDARGIAHRGRTLLTERHRTLILGQILNPNGLTASQCARQVQKRCKAEGLYEPSDVTIRRFIKQYSTSCFDEWTFFREGQKAWNDKCAISILRDWSLVGVGDVVIADGHTLNFETLDPETGKSKRMTLLLFYDGASNYPLGWEVMATENVECISSAFRRACIALGKYPLVVYIDNGKAFRAKYFEHTPDFEQAGFLGLYRSLGCSVIHAWSYHGQSKTIERFFGTFQEMEVLTSSYVGNSIANKPPRMNRGEVMHRKLYERMGGRPLTLEETHMAIAEWFGEYVHRPQFRSHLKGKTPREIFEPGVGPGVDMERLTLLMMQKEIRTITKDGIRMFGKLYWHEALSSRRHSVVVRYDNQSPHTVLVFDEYGEFICEARDREYFKIACGVHPAASVLGTAAQQEELAEAIELKRGQERLAGASVRQMAQEVVLPETQRQIEAKQQAKILPMPRQEFKPLTREEEEKIEVAKARYRAEIDTKIRSKLKYTPSHEKRFKDETERYHYLFLTVHESEISLDERDQDWMGKYEQSEFYLKYLKRRYDQFMFLFESRKKASQAS